MSAWAVNFPNVIMWVLWIGITYLFINYRDSKFKERENRQAHRELQEWFHENYILNGIDPVLAYISLIKTNDHVSTIIINPRNQIIAPKLPIQSLNRLKKILGDSIVQLITDITNDCYKPELSRSYAHIDRYIDHTRKRLIDIENTLFDLGHDMLGVEIADKLSTKDISEHEAIKPHKDRCSVLLLDKYKA